MRDTHSIPFFIAYSLILNTPFLVILTFVWLRNSREFVNKLQRHAVLPKYLVLGRNAAKNTRGSIAHTLFTHSPPGPTVIPAVKGMDRDGLLPAEVSGSDLIFDSLKKEKIVCKEGVSSYFVE